MATIAFLGLGAMGSRMARHLVAAGHTVRVWNRTRQKAGPVLEAGATWSETPAIAATNADFVLAMVRDDQASEAVWLDPEKGALAALRPGAIALDCSTLSLPWVATLAATAEGKGVAFLDAPVVGSRPQAEQRQLIFLVGGADTAVASATPLLRAMGTMIHHLGPSGSGALTKLAANVLFGIQVAAMAEIIPMINAHGGTSARIIDALMATPVASPAAKAAAAGMLAEAFAPLFPVEIVAKDFGYATDAAGQTPIITATRAVFQSAIAAGYGEENLTAVIRLYSSGFPPREPV